jgi:nucleoside-diphosphate-sugar epimerase
MSRIFLAGASGVIGRRLTPLLLDHGHSVWAATRSPDNGEFLRKLGALPVAVDVLEADALAKAVLDARPEIVIHRLARVSARRSAPRRRHADCYDTVLRQL